LTDKSSDEGGKVQEDVGVMKDKNPNLEEIEDSHTLGGVVGEDRVQGRGKWSTE